MRTEVVLTRRQAAIAALGLLPLAALLTRCANQAAISAQALADAQGLVAISQTIEDAINQYAPNAIPAADQAKVADLESAAVAALTKLSQSTPAPQGASVLETIDSDINTILGVIGAALPGAAAAFPALEPFIPMYDAAVSLLPAIEAWVNSVISPVTPTVSAMKHAKAIKQTMTSDQARAKLGIAKVR